MLTFLINRYCPKAFHRPNHLIRIVEYQRKIIPKSNIFTETRTQDSFRVRGLGFCNLLGETNNFVLCAVLLSCLVYKLQKPSSPRLAPRTVFGFVTLVPEKFLAVTNNFVLCAVLSCLVSELQKLSSLELEPRTFFRGYGR
jgi:hypothetical protein